MKKAYLISVYTDPNQLRNLLHKINKGGEMENIRFFIHVDQKVELKQFTEIINQFPNAQIIDKRIFVQWGGFGQVLYQKAMLESMLQSDIEFDRVFIITGQDYPILSNKEINIELSNNKDKEYVTGFNLTKSQNKSQLKNISWYHFFRDLPIKSYKHKKYISGGARLIMRCLPFRKKPYINIDDKKWDIFKSSSYMCLTYDCAKYVYEQLCLNTKLMDYFKTSYIPEEMVIPTIIFNSYYAKNATLIEDSNNLQAISAITYFHYNSSIKIFTEQDFDELINCKKMFARKFSSKLSYKLIEKLNQYEDSLG